jgi:uncharacterized phage protein (TIGR02218 family)
LTNGTIYGFTDAASNLTIDGVVYRADSGHTPSAIQTTIGLAVDNLDVQGLLDDSSITVEDLEAGLWDFAEVQIMVVNYEDLTMGHMIMRKGWLGNVKTGRNTFAAEMRGMTQKLQQSVGRVYAASCDATLGDARCGKNLAAYTVSGPLPLRRALVSSPTPP